MPSRSVAALSRRLLFMAVSAFHDPGNSDPFAVADAALQRLLQILAAHRQGPLLRRWIDHPYGEKEITLLEEEVILALLRLKEQVGEAHRHDEEERAEDLAQHRDEFSR
jgi:hypothetical protein